MRKINSPNELRACVEAYFRDHDGSDKNPPTMSGFARHCGFRSRTAFLTYINDDIDGAEYNEIIQDAKLRIEEYNETQLTLARNSSGARSRTAFLTYINDDIDGAEYNEIIQDAKLRIEEYNETQLTLARNSSGAQFALKNCGDGWAESLEVNGNFKHSVEEMLQDIEESDLGSGM